MVSLLGVVEMQQPCWLLSEELTSLYLPAAASDLMLAA